MRLPGADEASLVSLERFRLDWINQSSLLRAASRNETFTRRFGHSVSQSTRGDLTLALLRPSAATLCPGANGNEWFGAAHGSGGVGQSKRRGPDYELVQRISPLLPRQSRARALFALAPHCSGERPPSAREKSAIASKKIIADQEGCGKAARETQCRFSRWATHHSIR